MVEIADVVDLVVVGGLAVVVYGVLLGFYDGFLVENLVGRGQVGFFEGSYLVFGEDAGAEFVCGRWNDLRINNWEL